MPDRASTGPTDLAVGLPGRARRCFLLENVAEVKGATAEEHGKLCADGSGRPSGCSRERPRSSLLVRLPRAGQIDLTDLDGCPDHTRVLQTDLEGLIERFQAKLPLPHEFEKYSREENLCPYEFEEARPPRASHHRAVRASSFTRTSEPPCSAGWGSVPTGSTWSWTRPTTCRTIFGSYDGHHPLFRRAAARKISVGSPKSPRASACAFDIVTAAVEELIESLVREEDAVLPPTIFEDALLTALEGGN